MFRGANKGFKPKNWKKIEQSKRSVPLTPKVHEEKIKKLLHKDEEKRKKLKTLGIDYDFPGYVRTLYYYYGSPQNKTKTLTLYYHYYYY
jgi:hypothetical protein